MYTLSDLTSKVANSISEYIEFDVNEIFNVADYITIYGGAVRDSLAGLEIHKKDTLNCVC
jgi:tRNA nucleotidyltransferase/poly(A) polymerase